MIIGGLQKTTLIDYPGKIAATIFLSGCNFRCPWCYSSELVLPEKIKNQPVFSEETIFSFLDQRKHYLDGIVICGGEPTINPELPAFIRKIKEFGYSVKLDTNGSNSEMLKNLIERKLVDYIALDIKPENFQKESAEILRNSDADFEFRTTVVPEIHKKEDFIKLAKIIGGKKIKYYLQNFRPEKTLNPDFEKLKPYSREFLEEIKKSIKNNFEICEIR